MYTVILMIETIMYGYSHFFATIISTAGAIYMTGFLVSFVHFQEDHLKLFCIAPTYPYKNEDNPPVSDVRTAY